MDPLTLFALANGAVSAVKAGCKLYKEIKSATGDVKEVLKDLDAQFHKLHPPSAPASTEAKNQYVAERNRVIELNKRSENTQGLYSEIGEHLGTYYDNYYKCLAVFEEQERISNTEVYSGDMSIGKRALQRVLMRKQLQAMEAELRELMVYQCPKELGSLYTEVELMMKQVGKEQKVLVAKQMQFQQRQKLRRIARMRRATQQAATGIGIFVVILFFGFMMMWVAGLRQELYPQYGPGLIPSGHTKQYYKGKL